jgi:hypothetical protein
MCRHVSSWPGEIALNGRAIHHAGTGDNSAAVGQIRTCTSVVQICVRKMHFPIPLIRHSIKTSTILATLCFKQIPDLFLVDLLLSFAFGECIFQLNISKYDTKNAGIVSDNKPAQESTTPVTWTARYFAKKLTCTFLHYF